LAEKDLVTLSSQEFIVSRLVVQRHGIYKTDFSLWVWDPFCGTKSTLPPPPIPNMLGRLDSNYVCDGESVYVLTPVAATVIEEQPPDLYDVWMLNLREFNVRWRKLPSLPRLGKYVYSSSCEGESYIWQRRRILSSEADGWKLSGSGENDSKWHWQHINVNTPPPHNLNFDKSNRFPLYIEITTVPRKFLYARCPFPRHTPAPFRGIFPYYIFMFQHVDSDDSRPISYGDLYCFEVDRKQNGGLCLLKAELDNVKTRTVEESEWGDFVEDWPRDIYDMNWPLDFWEEHRDDHNYPEWPNHGQGFSSAIKVFMPMLKWKLQRKFKFENWMDKVSCDFKVVQNGPIYGYKLFGGKF
jgi:hypothetical protein